VHPLAPNISLADSDLSWDGPCIRGQLTPIRRGHRVHFDVRSPFFLAYMIRTQQIALQSPRVPALQAVLQVSTLTNGPVSPCLRSRRMP
jgi:hypothetical protein